MRNRYSCDDTLIEFVNRQTKMYLQLGWSSWAANLADAVHRGSNQGRYGLLSRHPAETNPLPARLDECAKEIPSEFIKLDRCKSSDRLLAEIDSRLSTHFSQQLDDLPLRVKLVSAVGKDYFPIARKLLQQGQGLGSNDPAGALITLCGYALVGLGASNWPQQIFRGCRICNFRNAVPSSAFCRLHRYSHDRIGQENPYAARNRAGKLKDLYFPRTARFRRRFNAYLVGISGDRTSWTPLIDACVVTGMAIQWLNELLHECPCVNDLVGERLRERVAVEDWMGLFCVLRESFDPTDYRTDLDQWCEKLLEAEAWLDAERQVTGRWSPIPVYSEDGVCLRSGQHIGGKRGPKEKTLVAMRQAIELAQGGFDDAAVAVQLGVSVAVIRQWEKRHLGFAYEYRYRPQK